ncbi:MAG: hypothetical protein SOZ07_08410 [Prevotella sp.]|nr:hypothetical protein [Prevotella sp.]
MNILKHFLSFRFIRLSVLCFVGLTATAVKAQSHGSHVMVSVGASYPKGLEATIAYESEMRYHSAMEYFANYYIQYATDPEAGYVTQNSFWHNYNIWNIGVAYKPCVTRGRNHHGNLRIGVSGGSDLNKFVGVGTLGYEHTFNLYNGWSVFFQIKEDVTLHGQDLFRTGGAIGVKIPF